MAHLVEEHLVVRIKLSHSLLRLVLIMRPCHHTLIVAVDVLIGSIEQFHVFLQSLLLLRLQAAYVDEVEQYAGSDGYNQGGE